MSNPHIKPADCRRGAAGTPALVGGTAGTILGEGEGEGTGAGTGAGAGGNCGGDGDRCTPRIAITIT